MAASAPAHLSPRKKPRQARATATLDAIFEATIQVLVADGPQRLTTTRVAERAGVSVGTMYQYFPHKQALFYALNERYLDVLAEKVESACRAQHGASIGQMIEALVTTYWNAKTERAEVTRALYRSVVELDNEPLIEAFARRIDAATTAMFASASDAAFGDLPTVNLTLLTTIFGAVRSVFERNLPASEGLTVHRQLVLMCVAYLEAVKLPSGNIAAGSSSAFALPAKAARR
jgi:AcrR family transcriptional regulator